jgi:hypothetical protein
MSAVNTTKEYVQGTLFEEDYLVRTLGAISHSPDVALTELVANAWDAGASQVDITIPSETGKKLIVEDDGTGLTPEQFYSRWMKLGYNRIKHQGTRVQFPEGRSGSRLAYGRNGVGRHALLCFNSQYQVITRANGQKSTFLVTTESKAQPFVLKSEDIKEDKGEGHGTRLAVVVTRNLPKPEKILGVLSARFLHDPQFILRINGESVPLEEHSGLIDTTEVTINGISLKLHFIDTQKAARTTMYQGIAFWQGGRLVGEPSWLLGSHSVIDGRTRRAKRYTAVVMTSDLSDYVLEDWTGFKKHDAMDTVYLEVEDYATRMFRDIAMDNLEETKKQIKDEFEDSIKDLSPLGRYEVDEAIESITASHPTARPEVVSLAIEAVVKLQKTRSGKELLLKISQLNDDDITGLNRLLDQWTVKDALSVLDEIDRRISVIEAIRKLSSDHNIDELKILHPLVTEARWLFGPEFDSPEYASNRQLLTAVKEIFKVEPGTEVFDNHRKRPDLVVLNDSTLSITATDHCDATSDLVAIDRILLIELKRGGFKIARKERNQAVGYIEDFSGCGSIIGNPYIFAFVVGEQFSEKVQPIQTVCNENKVEIGRAQVTTFGQLVDTAERRLFSLRGKLDERYADIPGIDLYRRATQLEINTDDE